MEKNRSSELLKRIIGPWRQTRIYRVWCKSRWRKWGLLQKRQKTKEVSIWKTYRKLSWRFLTWTYSLNRNKGL